MDRIEIGKLSAAYDVRRLGLADAPVVYAFCKADTQYYARCGAEVTFALAPAAGSPRRRWPPCRRRASGGAYWGWTRITPSPPTSGERTASGWCGSCRRTEVPSRWRKGSWTGQSRRLLPATGSKHLHTKGPRPMAGGLCFARCQGSTGSTLPPPGSSAVYSPSRLPPLSRRADASASSAVAATWIFVCRNHASGMEEMRITWCFSAAWAK